MKPTASANGVMVGATAADHLLSVLRLFSYAATLANAMQCAPYGHAAFADFRPSFRQLGQLRKALPNVPLMAVTATATERVRKVGSQVPGIAICLRVGHASCASSPYTSLVITMKCCAMSCLIWYQWFIAQVCDHGHQAVCSCAEMCQCSSVVCCQGPNTFH